MPTVNSSGPFHLVQNAEEDTFISTGRAAYILAQDTWKTQTLFIVIQNSDFTTSNDYSGLNDTITYLFLHFEYLFDDLKKYY